MNELKHPCASKCPEYKDEQCNHCLVKINCHQDDDQSMGTRTVYEPEFSKGDIVVLNTLNILSVTDLITLQEFDGEFWTTDHSIGRVSELAIRTATTAERHANRRLTKDEQSLAEVS